MSKISGFCEAGCKHEVVAKEIYDAKVAELEQALDELTTKHNDEIAALENKLKLWKKQDSEGTYYVNEGGVYRITKPTGVIPFGVYITVYSTEGGSPMVEHSLTVPTSSNKNYFEFELVSVSLQDSSRIAVITYKIDGVTQEQTNWDAGGETIVLDGIAIIHSDDNVIYKYEFPYEE